MHGDKDAVGDDESKEGYDKGKLGDDGDVIVDYSEIDLKWSEYDQDKTQSIAIWLSLSDLDKNCAMKIEFEPCGGAGIPTFISRHTIDRLVNFHMINYEARFIIEI